MKVLNILFVISLLNAFQVECAKTGEFSSKTSLPDLSSMTSFESRTQVIGSNFTFTCRFGSVDFWGYSFDNKSFHLLDTSSKYFNGIAGNKLSVLNTSLSDSLYFACYSKHQQSVVKLTVQIKPLLFLTIRNEIIEHESRVTFGSYQYLTVTCTAFNARPRAQIKVFNGDTGIPLLSVPGQGYNPHQECDPYVCRSKLSVNLTPGYAYWNNVSSIVCRSIELESEKVLVENRIFLDFDKDACLNNKCQNGSCIPSNKNILGYSCKCSTGFNGQYCREKDTCILDPDFCNSRGYCEVGANGNKYCTCFAGYEGPRCNFDPEHCSKLCKNNATCELVGRSEYVCKCAVGYKGKYCERCDDENEHLCPRIKHFCKDGFLYDTTVSKYCPKTCKICK